MSHNTQSGSPLFKKAKRKQLLVRACVSVFVLFSIVIGFMTLASDHARKAHAAASSCIPQITSVSSFAAGQSPNANIQGSCFGMNNTFSNADSPYFKITINPSTPSEWHACYTGDAPADSVTCSVSSWADTSITFSGFTGAYGQNGWVVNQGDPLLIQVWNPQTSQGPSVCSVVAGTAGTTQCNNPLLSITTTVTPKTPMWKMDAQVGLDPTNVVCPAALKVTIMDNGAGGKESATTPDICGGQAKAPSQTDVYVPVFNPHNPNDLPLLPLASAVTTVKLTNANQQQSSLTGNATVPPVPVWVGLGDSFASGYHQTSTQPRCLIACGLVKDDLTFSWLSSAVARLNAQLHVPSVWQMTADMEALSGSTTKNIVDSQDPAMVLQLTNHQGSWNVVSLNGGADDTNFASDLKDWYINTGGTSLEPWNVTDPALCVNTQSIWQKLQAAKKGIVANLNNIVADAQHADPNVRIATVDYPYLLKSANVCARYYFKNVNGKPVLQHGATSVINDLDGLYTQITGSQIALVDLRPVFSATNPLGYLQLLSDYGYPHPDQSGQQAIATAVATAISRL